MKTQKEAERAEQQRIKNLVLNLNESQEVGDPDGTDVHFLLQPNPNLQSRVPQRSIAHTRNEGLVGEKHQHNASLQQSPHHSSTRSSEKPGGNRGGYRARKLQLSDVDWYDKSDSTSVIDAPQASPRFGRPQGRSRERGRFRRTPG